MYAKYILYIPYHVFKVILLRIYLQGAQTVLHCATEPSLSKESGHLYRDCKLYVSKKELDPEVALRLWDISTELTT